jgi:hypothetical protein
MNTIEYMLHIFAYSIVLWLCLGTPLLLLIGLADRFGSTTVQSVIHSLAAVAVVAWLFVAGYLSRDAAHRRTVMGDGFWDALSNAVEDLRIYLALVPVMGRLLRGRGSRDSRFDKPPEPR